MRGGLSQMGESEAQHRPCRRILGVPTLTLRGRMNDGKEQGVRRTEGWRRRIARQDPLPLPGSAASPSSGMNASAPGSWRHKVPLRLLVELSGFPTVEREGQRRDLSRLEFQGARTGLDGAPGAQEGNEGVFEVTGSLGRTARASGVARLRGTSTTEGRAAPRWAPGAVLSRERGSEGWAAYSKGGRTDDPPDACG